MYKIRHIKTSKVYEDVEWYMETCCEDCGQIIHNHFDCPICKKEWVGTSIYSEVYNSIEFNCEECDEDFIFLGCDYD